MLSLLKLTFKTCTAIQVRPIPTALYHVPSPTVYKTCEPMFVKFNSALVIIPRSLSRSLYVENSGYLSCLTCLTQKVQHLTMMKFLWHLAIVEAKRSCSVVTENKTPCTKEQTYLKESHVRLKYSLLL